MSHKLRVRELVFLHDLMHGDCVRPGDYTEGMTPEETSAFLEQCEITEREFRDTPVPEGI